MRPAPAKATETSCGENPACATPHPHMPQLLLADDVKHSQDELRFHALGQTIEGRVLHVTFTLRDNQTGIRVISARDASRRESAAYAQKA